MSDSMFHISGHCFLCQGQWDPGSEAELWLQKGRYWIVSQTWSRGIKVKFLSLSVQRGVKENLKDFRAEPSFFISFLFISVSVVFQVSSDRSEGPITLFVSQVN